MTPCHNEDPYPNVTSPITVALAATQSASSVYGNLDYEIGTHLRDGTNLSGDA